MSYHCRRIIRKERQWQTRRGIREITRSTGLARNTIRKYILTAQSCGLARDGPPLTESQLITLVQLNRAKPRQASFVITSNSALDRLARLIYGTRYKQYSYLWYYSCYTS